MLFGKTRQAFYDRGWYLDEKDIMESIVLEMVAEIRREIPGIGVRKLYFMLQIPFKTHNIKLGRDLFFKLLQENNLLIKRKRRYVSTTDSKHWMKKYPNLIKEKIVNSPEQIWVADITYIVIKDDFNYLNLITDAYSKQIMGYCLHPTLEAHGTIKALNMALSNRKTPSSKLIHHSDRGTQYCSYGYVEILYNSGIEISMTENGDPYENPIAERINGILKVDFELHKQFNSRNEALDIIERSIRAYNEIRPHMSCNNLTPSQAHTLTGPLKKLWKNKTYTKYNEQHN